MGSWNYRIVGYADGGYALHDVGYEQDKCPTPGRCACEATSYTTSPSTFEAADEEGPAAIIDALRRALEDAEQNAVVHIPETWSEMRDALYEEHGQLAATPKVAVSDA